MNLLRQVHRMGVWTCAVVLLWVAPGRSLTITYTDFSDLSAFTLNGDTATINAGGPIHDGSQFVLRLSDALGQAGSAFLTAPITLTTEVSFSTYFKFRITDPEGISDSDGIGADGIVFAVQTVADTAGGGGGGIGYEGIGDSVGVEFDTWDNGPVDDDDGNHVGVDLEGDVDAVVQASVAPRMNDGDIWHAWVDYDGPADLLEVRLNMTGVRPAAAFLSHSVDLTAVLGSTDAFIGFTSGTGAAGGDHDILYWVFEDDFRPIGGGTVPEPGTIGLLAFGLATVIRRRRR